MNFQKAEHALKFYKGYKGHTEQEEHAIHKEFERQISIASVRKTEEKLCAADFCNLKKKRMIFDCAMEQ